MSYEAWRREVKMGRMADWNEDKNGYDPPPQQSPTEVFHKEYIAEWIKDIKRAYEITSNNIEGILPDAKKDSQDKDRT